MALKYLNGQHNLNSRHAKWVAYLQEFTFSIRHKVGTHNTIADALSRRAMMLSVLRLQVNGFDTLQTFMLVIEIFVIFGLVSKRGNLENIFCRRISSSADHDCLFLNVHFGKNLLLRYMQVLVQDMEEGIRLWPYLRKIIIGHT